jgi:Glycosyl transferases group 1
VAILPAGQATQPSRVREPGTVPCDDGRVTERRIRCALLTPEWREPQHRPESFLFACRGLELVALSPPPVGAAETGNPLGLPEVDRADVVLVTSLWYGWLTSHHPERADEVLGALERRADVIVGLDGRCLVALDFPPSALERFATVITGEGIYRDRDLYNYFVAPEYPGANWTEKLRPRRPRYRDADLDKLRLSLPSFFATVPAIRRRSRAVKTVEESTRRGTMRAKRLGRDLGEALLLRVIGVGGGHGRPLEVHCLTSLTHVQRIEALRLLEGFSGTQGIVSTRPDARISGTRFGFRSLPPEVRDELDASARPFSRERVGRLRFTLGLRRHRIGLSPVGQGEFSKRHGEVLSCGAALVCQDLSHLEVMFPFKDRVNVVFCRHDLSDLRSTVEELLQDETLRKRIGKAGRSSFMTWAAEWRAHLYNGIEAHIREALGLKALAGTDQLEVPRVPGSAQAER